MRTSFRVVSVVFSIAVVSFVQAGEKSPAYYPFYKVLANHARARGVNPDEKVKASFDGELQMVRVRLPRFSGGKSAVIRTPVGDVDLRRDHLLDSIDSVVSKFNDASNGRLPYYPERVDLITPPRYLGMRFAAISVYLGYRKADDHQPAFYVLEAGTAEGEPKSLFFNDDMDSAIVARAGYQPTPFTSPDNLYRGILRMDGESPETLTVWARSPRQGAASYIRVHCGFIGMQTAQPQFAGLLIATAAQRVALLAKTMNIPGQDIGGVLSKLGERLPWRIFPHREN